VLAVSLEYRCHFHGHHVAVSVDDGDECGDDDDDGSGHV
jgi:hypothetical protein